MDDRFDVIVIGGGHAGCEAAHAAARGGARTLLLTMRADRIGWMSCNPAVGGMAKGHLVREIDALGGLIGRITDESGIHFRTLNTRRGPAVRGSRAQVDRRRYAEAMQRALRQVPNLTVGEAKVEDLEVDGQRCSGVILEGGQSLSAGAVVVTAGTFLSGVAHIGEERIACGREGEPAAVGLSRALRRAGLSLRRFKTGTTPRLDGRTIRTEGLEAQRGDDPPRPFSCTTDRSSFPRLRQVPCWITRTRPRTHEIIEENAERSPLFTGIVTGRGPRYCPSIEEKVRRFADRESHTVFLEPDGLDTPEVYPAGLSTSLPAEVQLDLLRTIPGLEQVEILRPGYAIEYDAIDPTALVRTLMVREIEGLFLAGQVCGTSGYEEAAAQGFVAGVNAARWIRGREAFVLGRDEAYVGVLVDDLTVLGTDEPYRMFTSRAEHRLTLREDNADLRLLEHARALGLHESETLARIEARARRVADEVAALEREAAPARHGGGPARTLADLLRRPEVRYEDLSRMVPDRAYLAGEDAWTVSVEVKYAGYVARHSRRMAKRQVREAIPIPDGFTFEGLPGPSAEVVEKLTRYRPETLGQAGRISGVTPAAVEILAAHLACVRAVDNGIVDRLGGPADTP